MTQLKYYVILHRTYPREFSESKTADSHMESQLPPV
jgi:hypothetical protein